MQRCKRALNRFLRSLSGVSYTPARVPHVPLRGGLCGAAVPRRASAKSCSKRTHNAACTLNAPHSPLGGGR
eukprot:2025189-Alexandrium_andersonii.AAC.2